MQIHVVKFCRHASYGYKLRQTYGNRKLDVVPRFLVQTGQHFRHSAVELASFVDDVNQDGQHGHVGRRWRSIRWLLTRILMENNLFVGYRPVTGDDEDTIC